MSNEANTGTRGGMSNGTCGKGWDNRCRTATGGVCKCQCGGVNHGKDVIAGGTRAAPEPSLFGADRAKPDARPIPAPRAEFSTIYADNRIVVIVDENGPRTITNDAEAVVARLQETHAGKRVLYLDSDRNLDELATVEGRFAGFKHVLTRSVLRAIINTSLDD